MMAGKNTWYHVTRDSRCREKGNKLKGSTFKGI